MVILLAVVLTLAVAGCGAVVWAARGGPRWVRAVASVTLAAAEVVRVLGKTGKSGKRGGGSTE